jgi:protein TonB
VRTLDRWLALPVALSLLVHGIAVALVLEARQAAPPPPPPLRVTLLAEGTEAPPGPVPGPALVPEVAAPPPRAEPKPAPRPPPAASKISARATQAARVETLVAPPAPASAEPGAGAPAAPVVTASLPSVLPGAGESARRVFGEGEVDGVAAPARRVRPTYPPRERLLGREAEVRLEVLVEPDGAVSEVRVLASGGEAFDRAALAAVRRETWRPARKDGALVPSRVAFTVRFRLDED